jgi:hypothetical protein
VLQVTLEVPLDVCVMDFVFHNGTGYDAVYDNKGELDYHVLVKGGMTEDGQVVKEKPLHVVHITIEMAYNTTHCI